MNSGSKWRCIIVRYMLILISLFGFSSPVQGQIEFSEACDIALSEILDLQTVSAQEIIDREKQDPAQRLYCDYLENWNMALKMKTRDNIYIETIQIRAKNLLEKQKEVNLALQ